MAPFVTFFLCSVPLSTPRILAVPLYPFIVRFTAQTTKSTANLPTCPILTSSILEDGSMTSNRSVTLDGKYDSDY
jgi:hypothetical protein